MVASLKCLNSSPGCRCLRPFCYPTRSASVPASAHVKKPASGRWPCSSCRTCSMSSLCPTKLTSMPASVHARRVRSCRSKSNWSMCLGSPGALLHGRAHGWQVSVTFAKSLVVLMQHASKPTASICLYVLYRLLPSALAALDLASLSHTPARTHPTQKLPEIAGPLLREIISRAWRSTHMAYPIRGAFQGRTR